MQTQEIETPARSENKTANVDTFRLFKRIVLLLPSEARVAVVFVAICALCVIGIFICPWTLPIRDPWAAQTNRWTAESVAVVNQWLEALREGENGNQFWYKANYVTPVRLHTVTSWETVRSDIDTVWVRVDSSNASGTPIRKIWKIDLDPYPNGTQQRDIPKISKVEDADKD